jgi:anti-anti-sigma factor
MSAHFRRPVTETRVARAIVVALHGEFDLSNGAPVDIQLDAAIHAGELAIVVDLRDADLVNSTVINALFRACRQLHRRGGRLAIVATDRHARKVLELTAVDQAASVHETIEEAVAACSRLRAGKPGNGEAATPATAES